MLEKHVAVLLNGSDSDDYGMEFSYFRGSMNTDICLNELCS